MRAALVRCVDQDWVAGVSSPDSAVYASSGRIPRDTVVFAALALLVCLAASLVMSHRLSRPIARLTEAVEQFGAGDSDARAARVDGGEVGLLAARSNEMADAISSNTEVLERRVRERTHELTRASEESARTIDELQKALAPVRTLGGLLPICSSCTRIRNDEGYWTRIEAYIRDHSEAEFTHGICPECAKQLYPEAAPRADRTPGMKDG